MENVKLIDGVMCIVCEGYLYASEESYYKVIGGTEKDYCDWCDDNQLRSQ